MNDKIVELENGNSYVMLDKKVLEQRVFYFALRLGENDMPTNNYLFFEELKSGDDICLFPITDEETKGLLLATFTINYLDKAYDL